MKLDWRATAPGMREVYEDLSRALAGGDFYLAGGTALALLEGHRISVDLDLFSPTLTDAETLLEDLEGSLVYFAEADDDPPLRLLESISWDQVKTDLRAAVAGLL